VYDDDAAGGIRKIVDNVASDIKMCVDDVAGGICQALRNGLEESVRDVAIGRVLHLSASQLCLSRVCHQNSMGPPRIYPTKVLTTSRKVDKCKPLAIGRRKGGGDQLAAVIDLCSRAAQLAAEPDDSKWPMKLMQAVLQLAGHDLRQFTAGTCTHYPPRHHHTHFEPSFLESNSTL